MQSFDVLLVVTHNYFDMVWHSCDVTLVLFLALSSDYWHVTAAILHVFAC